MEIFSHMTYRRPVLSLSPKDMQIWTDSKISSLCIKEPAHLTKYSFALGLDYVKRRVFEQAETTDHDNVL